MERMGPRPTWRRQTGASRERQGDPPAEPRQVHGVAPVEALTQARDYVVIQAKQWGPTGIETQR